MPRVKDATRHADLAKAQVGEALELLWNELSAAKRERNEADAKVSALNSRFVEVRDAAISMGISLDSLTDES